MELTQTDFDRSGRREFLSGLAGSATAVGAASTVLAESTASVNREPKRPAFPATADTLIVLWMAGGIAHTETFDPKRYVPLSRG